jgi:hypothetical protein
MDAESAVHWREESARGQRQAGSSRERKTVQNPLPKPLTDNQASILSQMAPATISDASGLMVDEYHQRH